MRHSAAKQVERVGVTVVTLRHGLSGACRTVEVGKWSWVWEWKTGAAAEGVIDRYLGGEQAGHDHIACLERVGFTRVGIAGVKAKPNY